MMLRYSLLTLSLLTSASASHLRTQENKKWEVKPKCQSWCKSQFKEDKDPGQVCDYMRETKNPCTDCPPCVAKPAVQCQNWCMPSLKNKAKDHVKVCAYDGCAGCDPCADGSVKAAAAAKAAAVAEAAAAAKAAPVAEAAAAAKAAPVAEAKAAAVAEEVKPKAKAKVSCKKSCEKIKSLTGNFQCTKSCKKHLQQKAASAKVGQLATDPKIIKAAADAGKTPLEYAKSVVHLTPGEQAKVAQLAANHAKTQEQKKKNEAAAINGYKNFAEEMMKKINMSKEKAVMEAAINYLPTSRANCEKNRCIKEGTGVITDEEALFSGDGAPLGIKKVIYVECVVCPKTEDIYGCVDNSTNYSEYVAYLKCKEKAGHKFFKN